MKIAGKVLDVTDGLPLGGASVYVLDKDGKGTGYGTITDAGGNFYLDSPLLDNLYNKIAVSFVGYNEEKMSPTAAKGEVYLSRTGDSLGAVVVIGKRNIKKPVLFVTLLTSAIITIMIIVAAKTFKTSILQLK